MSVLKFLYQQLKESAGVSDIVGDRVYPVGEVSETVRPPYVTFQRVSNVHERLLIGRGSGLAHGRWQINAWARSAKESEQLGDAIRKALDNFSGDVDVGSETIDVRHCFLDNDEHEFEPSFDGTGRGTWSVRLDFIIWHAETITP